MSEQSQPSAPIGRHKPAASPTNDAEALRWLMKQHAAPCGDAACDSVYCYIADRISALQEVETQRDEAVAKAERALGFELSAIQLRAEAEARVVETRSALRLSEERVRALSERLAAKVDPNKLRWARMLCRDLTEALTVNRLGYESEWQAPMRLLEWIEQLAGDTSHVETTPAETVIRNAIYDATIGRNGMMLVDGREVYYRDMLAAFGLEKVDGWQRNPPVVSSREVPTPDAKRCSCGVMLQSSCDIIAQKQAGDCGSPSREVRERTAPTTRTIELRCCECGWLANAEAHEGDECIKCAGRIERQFAQPLPAVSGEPAPTAPFTHYCVECGPNVRFTSAGAMHFDAYGHTPHSIEEK